MAFRHKMICMICYQEVDHYEDINEGLEKGGYVGVYMVRAFRVYSVSLNFTWVFLILNSRNYV
jgi:hypothetical protein